MKAITVEPHKGGARLEDVPEPNPEYGSVLVQAVAVGVCGTDVEIAQGKYGWAPPGKTRLVLGHESLGRVLEAGPASGFKKGELVVGIVRRPDPVPCPSCAVGEWDMCRNGQYTERGIKQIDGFMSERWRIEPDYAIKIDPALGILGVLLEPTTVVAKAWEHILAVGTASLLGAEDRARDGGGADRSARCPRGQAVRRRGSRPRSNDDGAQARPRARARRDLPLVQRLGDRLRARRHHGVHRRRGGHQRVCLRHRDEWSRVPHGHRAWRRSTQRCRRRTWQRRRC